MKTNMELMAYSRYAGYGGPRTTRVPISIQHEIKQSVPELVDYGTEAGK